MPDKADGVGDDGICRALPSEGRVWRMGKEKVQMKMTVTVMLLLICSTVETKEKRCKGRCKR